MSSKVSGIGDYFSSELQIAEAESKLQSAEQKITEQQEVIQQLQAKAASNSNNAKAAAIFVPIDRIIREPNQVRRYFDPQKLAGLTESVKQVGIIEALWVRPLPDGDYKLVAGERRYRAASAAGLTEVPVTIRELDDVEALEISLVENLQRDDLNPVEETEGVLQLLSIRLEISTEEAIALLYRMKNEEEGRVRENVFPNNENQVVQSVFTALGRMTWQSFISSRLPLRHLPEEILEVLRQGRIDYTKARAIARVRDEEARQAILEEAIREGLSLSEIQARIKALKPTSVPSLKSAFKDVSQRLLKLSESEWSNSKKAKKIANLMQQLEQILNS